MYRVANIFFRLLNLFLKFALTFAIAKIITTEELGIYGTILASTTLLVTILGWELWYFFNRELTLGYQNNIKKTITILTDQFFGYILLYIFIVPLSYFYLLKNFEIYWMYIIVISISLHLSQEISRIYIHVNRHLIASATVLFVQSGWILVLLYYFYMSKELDLRSLLEINAQYASVFMLISIFIFMKIMQIKLKYIKFGIVNINFAKVIRTVLKSTKFLINVIFFLLGILIGRFVLESLDLLELTGVYSYYQNIASVSMVIVSFGLTSIIIPKLLQNKSNITEHNYMLKPFFLKTVYFSFFTFIIMNFIAYMYVFYLLEKDIFCKYFYVFVIINFAYFLINLNSYYASILYVWKKDGEIIKSNLYSLLGTLPLFGFLHVMNYSIELVSGIFVIWSLVNLLLKKTYTKKVLYDIGN